jgi:hypothetical protein
VRVFLYAQLEPGGHLMDEPINKGGRSDGRVSIGIIVYMPKVLFDFTEGTKLEIQASFVFGLFGRRFTTGSP